MTAGWKNDFTIYSEKVGLTWQICYLHQNHHPDCSRQSPDHEVYVGILRRIKFVTYDFNFEPLVLNVRSELRPYHRLHKYLKQLISESLAYVAGPSW